MTPDQVKALAKEAAEAAFAVSQTTNFLPDSQDAMEFIIQVRYDAGEDITLTGTDRELFASEYLNQLLVLHGGGAE